MSENESKITIQIPMDSQLSYRLSLAAAKLGISRQEYNRQALFHAISCKRFKEGMEKIYSKKVRS